MYYTYGIFVQEIWVDRCKSYSQKNLLLTESNSLKLSDFKMKEPQLLLLFCNIRVWVFCMEKNSRKKKLKTFKIKVWRSDDVLNLHIISRLHISKNRLSLSTSWYVSLFSNCDHRNSQQISPSPLSYAKYNIKHKIR